MPQATTDRIEKQELPELSFHGPFGGIQSELSADVIENLGFADCVNMILRKGLAQVRPGYTALASPDGANPILGINDFFDTLGVRHQVGITKSSLFPWDGSNWTQLIGALTGGAGMLFSSTVVNGKFLFSQGTDAVQMWDGMANNFGPVSPNAVPAFHMMELVQSLLVANTVENGIPYPQRVRWTGPGDPTDWTSFAAGKTDILSDLGPITGCGKIYQQGYLAHFGGLTQVVPTGIGTAPFNFVPFGSRGKGNIFPWSWANYGEEGSAYIGFEDVFFFNGTDSEPIGSRTIDGSRQVGARTSIMAELANSKPSQISGFISSDCNGNDYKAYWIVIPQGSTWVYNFKEANWSRFVFDKTPSVVGRFYNPRAIRIADLKGQISQQQWTPVTQASTKVYDDLLIGFGDGTPGVVDFTNYSESNWFITSGQLCMGDRRHNKDVTRFRLVYKDIAASILFTISITNEQGRTETKQFALGGNTGLVLEKVIPFHISGLFLTYSISGNAGTVASFVEFAPIYVTGGEVKTN
jgi:hypothetical protein